MYCANYMVVTLYIVAYYTLSRVLYYIHLPLVCIDIYTNNLIVIHWICKVTWICTLTIVKYLSFD
jgi:hypothetical protein